MKKILLLDWGQTTTLQPFDLQRLITSLWKERNLLKIHSIMIFKIGFSTSKLPHLHRSYVINGSGAYSICYATLVQCIKNKQQQKTHVKLIIPILHMNVKKQGVYIPLVKRQKYPCYVIIGIQIHSNFPFLDQKKYKSYFLMFVYVTQ